MHVLVLKQLDVNQIIVEDVTLSFTIERENRFVWILVIIVMIMMMMMMIIIRSSP